MVDSASNPPTTTYSFYGSVNAPSLGGEIIGQGVYFRNTNNNTIYSLLFVCGLNTYSLDGDTGEFKFDTIPQGTGVDNYVENYVKNTLDGMLSKDSSGKIAVGRGITVEADGNVAVKKSLEVSETTKLLGGLEPVATYLNTYKSDNDVRVYDFGILNKDKTEYGTDNAHLLVFVSRPLSGEGAKRSLSLVGFGKLDVSPQKIINYVEMAGNDITGTRNIVSLIYRPSDEIFSIKTYPDQEQVATIVRGETSNFQTKLYRHVIKLSGTDSNGYTYSGIIVYESTSNLKVDSLQDLTTLLKPIAGYEYPFSNVVLKRNIDLVTEIAPINTLQYDIDVWKFYGDIGISVNVTTVSDTVTPL